MTILAAMTQLILPETYFYYFKKYNWQFSAFVKTKEFFVKKQLLWSKKGGSSNKVGYKYGCYSEIEIAQESQWTAREILLRGIQLLEFMERRWGIPLGDNKAKVKALGLDFVIAKEGLKLEVIDKQMKDR